MNGWRAKPIFQRDPIFVDYAERMAKEIRETVPPLPRKKGQEPSTQRILDRPESEDAAWQARPLPTWEEAGAVKFSKDPNDMSMEELDAFVGARKLDPQETEIIRRLRQSGRGHTLGDAVSEGATGASPEARERAVNALVYSPGVPFSGLSQEDKDRITKLTQVEVPLPPEVEGPKKLGEELSASNTGGVCPMTELSFLIELLLNHKLPKPTREAVAARVEEVEGLFASNEIRTEPNDVRTGVRNTPAKPQRPRGPSTAQSPSTQAILAEKFTPDEIEKMAGGEAIEPAPAEAPITPPVPTTPMAAQALHHRQAAIMKAVNSGPFGGKPEDGRTSPRKF